MTRTLILGGGFGGLAVATELKRLLGPAHDVVVVDRNEYFSMGLRKLWALVGHATIADGSRSRDTLRERGVRVLRGEIQEIDPATRSATIDGETIGADYLVVALGAVSRPDLVPGLTEHGHDIWDLAGVPAATDALARFEGGRVSILIAGAPYPCPPAPYECAMHVHEYLGERGLRDRCELVVSTVQPLLMPNAGREGSAWMSEQLTLRGIGHRTGSKVERIDPGRIVFAEGELEFDLLIAVPPHRVPAVVRASGLTGEGEWIPVNPGTLETSHENVFAIGDVTQILLANGLPLPKAGVIAELEGVRVAAAIAADLGVGDSPPPFDGTGACFIEMGAASAALVEGDWYAEPEPRVTIAEPDATHAAEKRAFESERLERWFAQ
ncbi:MAG TPA: FAD/NAD(P)-binding oxidoreductase [Gaiellaceae bacterium]|nr:FAD/NAD(P)-binding oxidoreductase [Gaiellaceae bacterium]